MSDSAVSVFISFDGAFCVAAAALISSIARHKAPGYRLTLFIADEGVDRRSKRRIEQIPSDSEFEIVWLARSAKQEERIATAYLSATTHYPPTAYSRLIIAELVPRDISRIIYLDTDLLLRRDIAELWNLDVGKNTIMAAIDPLVAVEGSQALCGVPTSEAERNLKYGDYLDRLLSQKPDGSFHFSGSDRYFQSGVLLIDLRKYREADTASKLLEITSHFPELRFPDQDALNIALRGKIGMLDPRWNMVGTLYGFRSHEESPYDRDEFERILSDPWIVHFTSRPKPWHLGCRHPFLGEWYDALDRTPWKGWRPTRLNQTVARVPRAARILRKRITKALFRGRLGSRVQSEPETTPLRLDGANSTMEPRS